MAYNEIEANGADTADGWKKIGSSHDFWWWHPDHGFDLTRSEDPLGPPPTPRLSLETTNSPIIIAPEQTAMIIIDMQNFFLSRSLGRSGGGHAAETALIKYGLPAARKAQIQVIWLTWGVSDADLEVMSPTTARIFGFDGQEKRQVKLITKLRTNSDAHTRSVSVQTEKVCDGIGSNIGPVKLRSGVTVDGGRLLMQNQWNTALHAPLEKAFQEGRRLDKRPDVRFHKNRLSGMCVTKTECTEFLEANNIKTLLFGGVNSDQCVLATIQDANLRGFDTVLLQDGCATNSPEGAQSSTEYNCEKSWGFMSSCVSLAAAVNLDD